MTDARVVTAGEVGFFKGGSGFPVRFQGDKNGELPFFKVSDMNNPGNELFMRAANNYISDATRKKMGAVRLPAEAIVFAKVGAAVFLERKRILAQDSCIDNNMAAFIVDPSQVEVRFAHYLLSNSRLSDLVSTTALPSLNGSQMRSIQLRLPGRAEQRAVVEALSAADELISSLTALIVKKRAIKHGMMQELLTGRTRLPGFNGEWVNARLGSVLKVRNGRSQRDVEVAAGRYPILATGGEIGRTDTPIYTKPSVLIGRKGTIDRPQFQETPFWTVDTLFYTETSPQADARFLYYLCTTIDWISLNEATGVPSLTGARIESVEVVVPRREEQLAIANVLRDADEEINGLERRLEATRETKQGMMQELLTGRTRLAVKEDTA